jgi:hypothetical protein
VNDDDPVEVALARVAERAEHHGSDRYAAELVPLTSAARAAQAIRDIRSMLIRLDQIDVEQQPEHWLWDRVMTCDLPRLAAWANNIEAGTD